MENISFQILFILLLVLANGVFAMSEIAVVSSRKARLQQRANDGDKKAQVALDLATSPSRFLATIQVGITAIGTLAGAFSGATIAKTLEAKFAQYPLVAEYSTGMSLILVVALVTYFQVVLGELVPKSLALTYSEQISRNVAKPMRTLSRIAAPLVGLLGFSTELILKLLGVKAAEEPPVSEDEINVMMAQGTQAGIFHEAQKNMVESVFELSERRVNTLMTPRPDLVWLDLEDSPEENRSKILHNHLSSFPVCRDNLDNTLGIVYTKDLLGDCLSGKPFEIEPHIKKALAIPETIPALKCLELFRQSGFHIALVFDEYGGLQGLVTLNDIFDNIVGDLATMYNPEEDAEAFQRDDGSWLVDGMLPVEDLKDLLKLRELAEEDTYQYQTVGGFVMTLLGHIPRAGDKFQSDGLTFEVMDMDGNRVDKVLITGLPPDVALGGRNV